MKNCNDSSNNYIRDCLFTLQLTAKDIDILVVRVTGKA